VVKYVSIFKLKAGADAEETDRVWMHEHVPYVKEVMSPELTSYVVGKVVHDMTEGETFYGSVQLGFRSLEDAKRAWDRMLAKPPDRFYECITDIRRVIIEETDVFT